MRHVRVLRAVLLASLIGLGAPLAALAQTVDPDFPTANGAVTASVLSGTTLYIGGAFTELGPRVGGGVPVDAATAIRTPGFPVVRGQVFAAAPDGAGGWYIGGKFDQVGGLTRGSLAHVLADNTVSPWNPSVDVDGYIRAIAVSGSTVYFGGYFSRVSTFWDRSCLAAVDASTGAVTGWAPVVSWWATIYAIVVDGSRIVVGGYFDTAGAAARNNLAAIDATTAQALNWIPEPNGVVHCMALDGSTLYVGGEFTSIAGQFRNYAGALDVVTGSPTGWDPNANARVLTLSLAPGVVYLGGQFTQLNGLGRSYVGAVEPVLGTPTTWNPGTNNVVSVLASSGSSVYVGGSFTSIGSQRRNYVATVDASGVTTSWDPHANGAVYALTVAGPAVFMGGTFTSVNGWTRNHIAAVDITAKVATSWDPGADGNVTALALSGSSLYAAGDFKNAGGAARVGLAELDLASGAATAWNPGNFNNVKALVVSNGVVYLGGAFWIVGNAFRSGLAAVDAATGALTPWNPGTTGNSNSGPSVACFALSGNTLYVGGEIATVGGQPHVGIAQIDAPSGVVSAAWNPGVNGAVYSMSLNLSSLLIGGSFTSVAGESRPGLAELDAPSGAPTAWNPVVSGAVESILPSGAGPIYAGGNFTTVGGLSRGSLAAVYPVNGAVAPWNPVVSGVVTGLSRNAGVVYATGTFTSVLGQSLPNLAAISESQPCPPGTVSISGLQDVTVLPGASVTLSVTAAAPPPLQYQWFKSSGSTFGTISGANTSSLALANINACDAADYKCVVTTCSGSVSAVATVNVQPSGSIPPYTEQWVTSGTAPMPSQNPGALAIAPNGDVFVTDPFHFSIHRYVGLPGARSCLLQWGSPGSGTGQFGPNISDVAVDRLGDVYVVDPGNHRVEKFSPNGVLITSWAGFGTGGNDPYRIAIDRVNDIVYVSEGSQSRVSRFQLDGTLIGTRWATSSFRGIAVAPDGSVVGVLAGKLVNLSSADGHILSQVTVPACSDPGLMDPRGIAVDPCGGIYVTDGTLNRVMRWNAALTPQRRWGFDGTTPVRLSEPRGIAVSPDGHVYVADYADGRIVGFGNVFDVPCNAACDNVAPLVTVVQPLAQSIVTGESTTLTAAVNGPNLINYQWLKDGLPIVDDANRTGATTAQLKITHTQPADAGLYLAQAANTCDTIATPGAALVVGCGVAHAPPPPGMVAWWGFDELTSGYVRDLAHLYELGAHNHGTLTGSATLVPGLVGKALHCVASQDGMHIAHASTAGMNFGEGSFGADAWIYPQSGRPAKVRRMIVAKNQFWLNFSSGYAFYLRDGKLGLQVGGPPNPPIFIETAAVVTNDAWHHVAFVVDRTGDGIIRFYRDGVQVQMSPTVPFSATTPGDLDVGRFDPGFGAAFADSTFGGDIDEVELFGSHIPDSTMIRQIWAARCAGKARVQLSASSFLWSRWDEFTSLVTVVTNGTSTDQSYNWVVTGPVPGSPCPDEPLLFNPSQGMITLAPGERATIPIAVQSLDAPPLTTCYSFALTSPTDPGLSLTTTGAFRASATPISIRDSTGAARPVGAPGRLALTAFNDSSSAVRFRYSIGASLSSTGTPSQVVQVNGLPAGAAYVDSVTVPPHGSAPIRANVTVIGSQPFPTDQIVFSADLLGSGIAEPLIGIPLMASEDTTNSLLGVPGRVPASSTRLEAWPNPFRNRMTLNFSLPEARPVDVRVFDVAGRLVRLLHTGPLPAGPHQFEWDGRADDNHNCANGIYFVRMIAGSTRLTTRVVELR